MLISLGGPLKRARLDQREAARALEVSERGMARYCTSKKRVPQVVILAFERLADLETRQYAEKRPDQLEIEPADMRAYSAGEKPIPRFVILALERVVDMRRKR